MPFRQKRRNWRKYTGRNLLLWKNSRSLYLKRLLLENCDTIQLIMVGNNQKKNTTYVFVDASNVWSIVKSARKFIEYKNLKSYFEKKFNSNRVEVFYYDAYPKEGTREYDLGAKHRFFTYLKKGLGFVVRKKELKRISVVDKDGELIVEKGNMDVEITIDAMHNKNKYDIAILFTGDCDFLP